MTVQMDFWQLIGMFAALFTFMLGAIVALGKVALKQFEDRQNSRFTAIEQAVSKRDDDFTRLEREWMKFLAELPVQYVRREDYVRGQSVIEAKLDALYNKLEVVQLKGAKYE